MAPAAQWKPCEVLVNGCWLPGFLERWRQDPRDGWRALVRYYTDPGLQYLNWQPAERLRPRQPFTIGSTG